MAAPVFGHVGDGNFHVIMLLHPDDPPAYRAAQLRVNERLIARAIEMGGTCTGEHGVGAGKIAHLPHEHGEGAMRAMAAVKRALDPQNIMNPGKIFDLDRWGPLHVTR